MKYIMLAGPFIMGAANIPFYEYQLNVLVSGICFGIGIGGVINFVFEKWVD
jgi:hypothetical protein